jgi:hypothetical protein
VWRWQLTHLFGLSQQQQHQRGQCKSEETGQDEHDASVLKGRPHRTGQRTPHWAGSALGTEPHWAPTTTITTGSNSPLFVLFSLSRLFSSPSLLPIVA